MDIQPTTSAGKKKFIAIMAGIAAAMAGSWFVMDSMVGFDRVEGFPLGPVIILADLAAFVVIGVILKKKLPA